MKSITYMILYFAMIWPQDLLCQAAEKIILHKQLLVQTTLSPGYFFESGLYNLYFHPDVEYFFEKNISIRTDAFYFTATSGNTKPLEINHTMLLGAFYHFRFKKSSLYAGWQPGAAYVKQNAYWVNDSLIASTRLKIAPVFTITTGVNYYFWRFLNFFAALNYVHGRHIAGYGPPVALDELRFSGGLGCNFNTRRKKPITAL